MAGGGGLVGVPLSFEMLGEVGAEMLRESSESSEESSKSSEESSEALGESSELLISSGMEGPGTEILKAFCVCVGLDLGRSGTGPKYGSGCVSRTRGISISSIPQEDIVTAAGFLSGCGAVSLPFSGVAREDTGGLLPEGVGEDIVMYEARYQYL